MEIATELLEEAERAARDARSWADLSNFLFNPVDGLVARAYPTRQARQAFVQTDEYRKIRQLIAEARQRYGLVEGASPRKSSRLLVELPQSLHAALEREAIEEGVSLDQLVLSKLAIGLGRHAKLALRSEEEEAHTQR